MNNLQEPPAVYRTGEVMLLSRVLFKFEIAGLSLVMTDTHQQRQGEVKLVSLVE